MRRTIVFLTFILAISFVTVFADTGNTGGLELQPKLDTYTGKYGYVDNSGKWVIPPSFQYASEFSEGLASVRPFDENDRDMSYAAYINTKGEFAFDKKFFLGYSFKDGYAIVADKEEKISVIDKQGNVVLKTDYYKYGDRSEIPGILTTISNYHPGRSAGGILVGYITKDLKLIKPMFNGEPGYYRLDAYEEAFPMAGCTEYDSNGRIKTSVSYLINRNLEPVKMPEGFVSSIKDGMILINGGDTFAFMDLEGNIYDEIHSSQTGRKHKFVKAWEFNDGHALVAVEEVLRDPYGDPITAYGYINKDGTTFMEPKFSAANSFKEGLAAVQLHYSYQYGMAVLKADGQYLIPPQIRQRVVYEENEKDLFAQELHSQGEYDFVKAEVKRIAQEITTKGMSELQKLEVLHKYVMDRAVYSLIQPKMPNPLGLRYQHEAIGILKDRLVVCESYTKLLGLLLNEVGIENIFIFGEADPGETGNYIPHSWNLVKIGGKYYHVDATWDDDEGPNKYYLVSDKYIKKSRIWEYSNYPEVPKGYFNDEWQPKK